MDGKSIVGGDCARRPLPFGIALFSSQLDLSSIFGGASSKDDILGSHLADGDTSTGSFAGGNTRNCVVVGLDGEGSSAVELVQRGDSVCVREDARAVSTGDLWLVLEQVKVLVHLGLVGD